MKNWSKGRIVYCKNSAINDFEIGGREASTLYVLKWGKCQGYKKAIEYFLSICVKGWEEQRKSHITFYSVN